MTVVLLIACLAMSAFIIAVGIGSFFDGGW